LNTHMCNADRTNPVDHFASTELQPCLYYSVCFRRGGIT
jgi:hypothetical protein